MLWGQRMAPPAEAQRLALESDFCFCPTGDAKGFRSPPDSTFPYSLAACLCASMVGSLIGSQGDCTAGS